MTISSFPYFPQTFCLFLFPLNVNGWPCLRPDREFRANPCQLPSLYLWPSSPLSLLWPRSATPIDQNQPIHDALDPTPLLIQPPPLPPWHPRVDVSKASQTLRVQQVALHPPSLLKSAAALAPHSHHHQTPSHLHPQLSPVSPLLSIAPTIFYPNDSSPTILYIFQLFRPLPQCHRPLRLKTLRRLIPPPPPIAKLSLHTLQTSPPQGVSHIPRFSSRVYSGILYHIHFQRKEKEAKRGERPSDLDLCGALLVTGVLATGVTPSHSSLGGL